MDSDLANVNYPEAEKQWSAALKEAEGFGPQDPRRPWLAKLLERRSTKIAAIALANKIARTAWAMMAHGTFYKEPAAQAD